MLGRHHNNHRSKIFVTPFLLLFRFGSIWFFIFYFLCQVTKQTPVYRFRVEFESRGRTVRRQGRYPFKTIETSFIIHSLLSLRESVDVLREEGSKVEGSSCFFWCFCFCLGLTETGVISPAPAPAPAPASAPAAAPTSEVRLWWLPRRGESTREGWRASPSDFRVTGTDAFGRKPLRLDHVPPYKKGASGPFVSGRRTPRPVNTTDGPPRRDPDPRASPRASLRVPRVTPRDEQWRDGEGDGRGRQASCQGPPAYRGPFYALLSLTLRRSSWTHTRCAGLRQR